MNNESIYLPKPATIKNIRKLTDRETLFEIMMDDNHSLGHKPGQFVEVSIMGIGEAPISVSSSPTQKDSFELCVRAVGSVTKAMHKLSTGDKLGIRGPFGRGFDTEFLKGKDLLFMCAGLGFVPLRSLINYVLHYRAEYGKVTILYGCKTPSELLFTEEVQSCHLRNDVQHCLTVDKVAPEECWDYNVGVITTLIPKVEFNPKTTYAIVVGPPIMYKFAVKALKERDMADDHIIVSLERRMKCGVGKCGHCQINGLYVCKDGPVFNYSKIKNLQEAL
jgi:sulfite reductase subunit B